MAYELKDGQGSLHRNDKGGNEARPDYRGEANIGGQMFKLAGWLKDGKKGKWLSLKIDAATETYKDGIRKDPPRDDDDRPPF